MRTVALLLLAAVAGAGGPEVAQSVSPGFFLAEWEVADVDGDGRDDLLLIGVHGEVRVWRSDAAGGRLEDAPRGTRQSRE